jgi:hypothetical protein
VEKYGWAVCVLKSMATSSPIVIEEALAEKKPKQKRRMTRKGDTKKRVLTFIAESPEPVGPAEVRDALNATGDPVGSSAIYNTFRRLQEAGEVVRVDEGLYELPARNGDRAKEIEETESLSMTTAPHEGNF